MKNVSVLRVVTKPLLQRLLPETRNPLVCLSTKPTEKDENVNYFLTKIAPSNVSREDFDKIPMHGCLVWSPKTGTREILDKQYTPINEIMAQPDVLERREYLIREIGKMLDVFPEYSTMAECHFEFLLRSINPFIININDFSIVLRSKKCSRDASDRIDDLNTSTCIGVSIVDYLICCQIDTQPKQALINLHEYFCKIVTVPDVLIKNRFMLGLT